jgi:thiamine kinase-like enzyme
MHRVDEIPDSIRSLLSSRGETPIEIHDVTVRAAVANKRTYRLVFDGGRQAKARLLMGSEHAARWGDLRRRVSEQPFLSSLLLQSGTAVLEEWVEGEVLPHANPPENLLQKAGAVLARIHRTAVPEQEMADAGPEAAKICSMLSALTRLSAITQGDADELTARLSKKEPKRMHRGLAHHDFCGDNLVLHVSRGVVSIDHEWMRVGSLDFDVARAIRQWNLPDAGIDVFLRGYAAAGGPVDIAHLDFWLLANDIFASEVRVRRGWSDAPATVKRLMSWIER